MRDNYINRIIGDDRDAFDQMYKVLKPSFISSSRSRFNMDKFQAEDLYHESLAVLYNNVKTGRLVQDGLPDDKLPAYVLTIAKYIHYNKLRKRQVPLVFDTKVLLNNPEPEDIPYDKEKDDKLFIIRATVRDMPEPCSHLLKLAIYEEKKNSEIAAIMKYSNADSAKVQRSKCMQKLRDETQKRLKQCGYEQKNG